MEVIVHVPYKIIQGLHTYSYEEKEYKVKPFKITRSPTGSSAIAKTRFYYTAHFIGFDDMICPVYKKSAVGNELRENIRRKINPKFNPKKLTWVGNTARLV